MKFERDTPISKALPYFKKATRKTPTDKPLQHALMPHVRAGGGIVILVLCMAGVCWWQGWPISVAPGVTGLIIAVLFVLDYITVERTPYSKETIRGHKAPKPPVPLHQNQAPSLAVTYHRSERHRRLDDLPGPPNVILAWAEVFIRGGSVAYKTWEPRFGSRIDENDKEASLYREFRAKICGGDNPLAREQGKHGLKPTKEGYEQFSDLVRVGLDNATPLLDAGDAQGTENDRWEPPTHTDTPAGE